jgi:hypothetical protein
MIAARVFAPASKLATARGLGPETLNRLLFAEEIPWRPLLVFVAVVCAVARR